MWNSPADSWPPPCGTAGSQFGSGNAFALPANVPLLADAAALDLALVFIMSTPPARDPVVRWFKNPAASRDEAMRLLKTMGRMVESYRRAMEEALPKPPPPPDPAWASVRTRSRRRRRR